MITTISNPPYNLSWEPPLLASMQDRFTAGVPPQSNANLAFILTALHESDSCVFILPCGLLLTSNKKEKEIIKYLIESNFVEAVILCPNNMFESTNIPVCILLLNEHKKEETVLLVDMQKTYTLDTREQKGQFGSKAHTNRIYKKEIKTFSDEQIDLVTDCVKKRLQVDSISKTVTIEDIRQQDYVLMPNRYLTEQIKEQEQHRSYEDIVSDINRVIREKNKCKLTINETIAKQLGFDLSLYKSNDNKEDGLNLLLEKVSGNKLLTNNYFQATKNKNEIKFENKDKESISSIFMMIFNMWKQHIYYLNQEENRYLIELRDALLPDLMSGEINLEEEK